MASLGLPGLAGFWGEFPAILSAYSPGFGLSEPLYRTLMVIAAIGTVLAAAYLLWLYQRTAFGTPSAEFAGHSDAEHAATDGHGQRRPLAERRRQRRPRRRTTTTSTTSASSSGSPGRRS